MRQSDRQANTARNNDRSSSQMRQSRSRRCSRTPIKPLHHPHAASHYAVSPFHSLHPSLSPDCASEAWHPNHSSSFRSQNPECDPSTSDLHVWETSRSFRSKTQASPPFRVNIIHSRLTLSAQLPRNQCTASTSCWSIRPHRQLGRRMGEGRRVLGVCVRERCGVAQWASRWAVSGLSHVGRKQSAVRRHGLVRRARNTGVEE